MGSRCDYSGPFLLTHLPQRHAFWRITKPGGVPKKAVNLVPIGRHHKNLINSKNHPSSCAHQQLDVCDLSSTANPGVIEKQQHMGP